MIEFRRARPEDFPAILKLQADNYIANLPPKERTQGFLSAEFTEEQIAAIAADIGIIVASDSGSVLGYLCGFRCDFDHHSPVIAKMLEAYDTAQFQGRALASYKSFIYGPVCIDQSYRGRGLLQGLYQALKREVAGQFEVGVAFVARDNPHSLQAHVTGLGMLEVGEFQVKENDYAILAFSAR